MATRIDLSLEDLHHLRARVDRQQLERLDWVVIGALVSRFIARTEARQARLKAQAAQQAANEEAKQSQSGPADAVELSPGAEDTAATEESSESAFPSEPAPEGAAGPGESARTAQEQPKKGHGRNGAGAFINAVRYAHGLASGIIGSLCALCRVGRVSPYRDKVIIRVVGQPLFAAQRHHFEQGRCRLCGALFTAEGSERVVRGGIGTSYITYDWSACAMLIVMHYFAGAPFKRLEALHQGWGVLMPDANQWRLVDACDDLLAPGFYIETEQARVVLFFTGRHHAGEMIDQLLERRRAGAKKLVALTDAASKNFSHDHADQLEQAVCNAHCYLKFRAVKDQFPAEYAVAAEVYAKVFDNDDKAKALGLDPRERMLHHRKHSKPQMLRLLRMCKDKTDGNLVEPNSPLWEPVSFVLHQWSRLTRFYEVPGVPLDTNLAEQALIIPVRYLAGSFAYKTQNGADVGDRHMSLIATANASGVEPVAYLTECLRNHEDLAKRPDHYLPWVYRHRLEELDQVPRAQAPPPPSPPPRPQGVQHPLRSGTHRAHRPAVLHGAAEQRPMAGPRPDG